MTTTTYHVGPGQTYATLNAWQAAGGIVRNLVAADEKIVVIVHGGSNCLSGALTLDAGWTTDATRNITIQANTGQQWSGLYADTTVAAMNARNVAYGSVGPGLISNNGKHLTLSGLYLIVTGTGSSGCSGPLRMVGCCLHFAGNTGGSLVGLTLTAFSGQIVNCLFAITGAYDEGQQALRIASVSQTATPHLVGCTFVLNGTFGSGLTGLGVEAEGTKGLNTLFVAACANSQCIASASKIATWDHCMATGNTLGTSGTLVDSTENLATADLMSTVGAAISDTSKARRAAKPHAYGNDASGKAVDAFGNQRLTWDIGCYQTLPMTATEIQNIFKDFGLFVRTCNLYASSFVATLTAESAKRAAQLSSGMERLSLLSSALRNDAGNMNSLSSWADSEASALDAYIRGYLRTMTGSTGSQASEVLAELDYCMSLAGQKVAGIAVAAQATVVVGIGNGTISSLSVGQGLSEQVIQVKCVSAQTAGAEQWQIDAQVDRISGMATTGQVFTDDTTGLSFKIDAGAVAWAEGDRILIHVTNEGQARFQGFFRDRFDYVFDQNALDGTETVLDSWAE